MASKIDPAVEKATDEFRRKFQALRDEIGKYRDHIASRIEEEQ